MRQSYLKASAIICSLLGFMSCSENNPEYSAYNAPDIIRLEEAIKSYPADSTKDINDGLSMMLTMFGCKASGDSDIIKKTDSIRNTSAYRFFINDVETKFQNLDTLCRQLGFVSANLDDDVNFPKRIYTLISPYRQSIMTVDSTALFIALNHYMGPDYAPYESFPAYERINKRSDRIPYDVAESIIRARYPFEPTSSSLLCCLAYEGAVKMMTMQCIENASLSAALGWTEEQLKWAMENEHMAWVTMAERDMIYSESGTLKAQMTGPAPSTSVLHPDSPGGFGRFLGYRIMDSYLRNNPEMTVSDFLKDKVYNSPILLRQSDYRP